MAISLHKGQRISLTKVDSPSLQKNVYRCKLGSYTEKGAVRNKGNTC